MTRQTAALLSFLLIGACGEPAAPPILVRQPNAGLTSDAPTETFYGPERFVRSTGPTTRFSRTIPVTGVIAPFVLHIRNGMADGSSRVSSARVSLDGAQLLGPKNFNPGQAEWNIPVDVGASALLAIELTSRPGSFLEVWMTGAPAAPPPPTWIQLSPTGTLPEGRYFPSVVYDESNDRMIVFGGANEFPTPHRFNDVLVLEHASGVGGSPAWTQLTTAGPVPSPRSGHSAVYDPATNRMTVFGGNPGSPFMLSEVWVLSNANGLGGTPTWTQLSPASGPAARTYHSATYDAAGNRMIVFGGNLSEGNCFDEANDVWVLSNANGLGGAPSWAQLSPSGGPPGVRDHGGAIYDAASNRMMTLWGRVECQWTALSDIWTLDNANGVGPSAWSQLTPSGAAPPRSIFTIAYDAATQSAIISGGVSDVNYYDDVWVLSHAVGPSSAAMWTQIHPVGTGPGIRIGNRAVYNSSLNRMIVFGGNYDVLWNDVWVLTRANGQ